MREKVLWLKIQPTNLVKSFSFLVELKAKAKINEHIPTQINTILTPLSSKDETPMTYSYLLIPLSRSKSLV
jgi:hypothetical protein